MLLGPEVSLAYLAVRYTPFVSRLWMLLCCFFCSPRVLQRRLLKLVWGRLVLICVLTLKRIVKPSATVRYNMIPSWSLVVRMAPLVPLLIPSLVEGLLVGLWTLSRLWMPGEFYE